MSVEISQPVRFHLSINVSDLGKSVRFFEALFGKKPAKQRSDYAKFELDDPPLVLSLEPHAPAGRGALNHAGFRFPDATKLVEASSAWKWPAFTPSAKRESNAATRGRRNSGPMIRTAGCGSSTFWKETSIIAAQGR